MNFSIQSLSQRIYIISSEKLRHLSFNDYGDLEVDTDRYVLKIGVKIKDTIKQQEVLKFIFASGLGSEEFTKAFLALIHDHNVSDLDPDIVKKNLRAVHYIANQEQYNEQGVNPCLTKL